MSLNGSRSGLMVPSGQLVNEGLGAQGPDRALSGNVYGGIVQVLEANTPWAGFSFLGSSISHLCNKKAERSFLRAFSARISVTLQNSILSFSCDEVRKKKAPSSPTLPLSYVASQRDFFRVSVKNVTNFKEIGKHSIHALYP